MLTRRFCVLTKAIITVRSGSKRVKNKNLKPFAGSNLLEIKIKQMQRIKGVDAVQVNSNDDTMLQIGKDLGCEIFKRDEYYATDMVSTNELRKNAAENIDADIILVTNCTNPLIKDETIEKALEFYKTLPEEYDSLNTAHEVKDFLWLNGKAYNYNPDKTPRSQDLPDILGLDSALNIIKRERMIEISNFVGKTPYLYKISALEATDIDTELDFEVAEYLYKKIYGV